MDMSVLGNFLAAMSDHVAGPDSRLWPAYLAGSVLIAYLIYRRRNEGTSFVEWLVPKSVYLHASHMVDLKVFVVNRAMAALGIFNLVFLSAFIATRLPDLTGQSAGLAAGPVLIGFLLLVVGDLAVYIVHRFHHENRIFWPFHSLHHSAEVMTPITVYRKHPVYDLVSAIVKGVLIGTLQGAMIALFAGEISFVSVVGVNAFYVAFNMAASNLRHTHIWLSFGRVLEHVFISPAQHQVHHSIDPRHHNKNYGEVLAIWDWMFGTLYVPSGEEKLEFGIGDAKGARIAQPHDSLTNAMLVPLKDSWKQIVKQARRAAKHKEASVTK